MKIPKEKKFQWTSYFLMTLLFTLCLFTLPLAASTTPLAEGDFELPDLVNGVYKYQPLGTSWTYLTHAGVSSNNSGFTNNNPAAPQGDQVLFIQLSGSVSKNVQLSAGTYRFSMKAAQRKRQFSTDQQTFIVKLDGQIIGTFTPNNDQYEPLLTDAITLVGGTHQLSIEGTTLPGNDNTAFVDDIQIITEQTPGLWSDPNTWENGVPDAQTNVVIPPGKMVLLDIDTEVRHLHIKGKLIADQSKNLNLSANWIMVEGSDALLLWGSELVPYTKRGIITLKHEPADSLPGPGSKFLAAMNNARVEIHGQPRLSWTQLDGTAQAGSSSITLRDLANWNIGDQIVIASTDFNAHQAEVRTITGVSLNGRTFELNSPLTYMHYGQKQVYNNGGETFRLDQSAEVGLLSRNITIQGDAASELDGFGGHTMFMPSSFVKFSGVELYRMGQKSLLARYPFHWHLAQEVDGQYIKNSSIHRSFNRTVTVHGTNNALVEDNVSYDHIGHGYYLENGSEVGNTFKHNLGILTRIPLPGEEVTAHDADSLDGKPQLPSTFWISNPANDFIDNASAGSEGSGFWILALKQTIGDGDPLAPPPGEQPLGKFEGNRSHSNTDSNLSIGSTVDRASGKFLYNGSTYRPLKSDGSAFVPEIIRFTGFKSTEKNIWTQSTTIRIDSAALADCLRNTYFSFSTLLVNSLIVGKSNNIGTPAFFSPNESLIGRSLPNPNSNPYGFKNFFGGFSMYNGSNEISNVHFAGFNGDNSAAIMTIPGNHKSPVHLLDDISFDPAVPDSSKVNFNWMSFREGVYTTGLIDMDGTLTGVPGTRLTPKINPRNGSDDKIREDLFNRTNTDLLVEDWNAYLNTTEEFSQLYIFNRWDAAYRFPIYNIRSDGAATYDDINSKWHKRNPVIVNKNFKYFWQYHKISNKIEPQLRFANQGDEVISVFPNMPSSTYVYNGSFGSNPAPAAASLAALENSSTSTSFFQDNTLYIKHVATEERDPDLYGDHNAYASPAIRICQHLNCAEDRKSTNTVTLADFEMGIDGRISRWGSGLPIPTVTTSGIIDPHDNIDTKISWTITDNNDGDDTDYVQIAINFPRQIWTEFKTIIIKATSESGFQFYSRDASNGFKNYGVYQPGTDSLVHIPLSLVTNPNKLDEVNRVIIRIRESYLEGASSATINLFDIKLSVAPAPGISAKLVDENQKDTEEEFSKEQLLEIYPNPAKDQFTLSYFFKDKGVSTLQIFDLRGSLVFEQQIDTPEGYWSKTISGLQLGAGLYKAVLQTGKRGLKTANLVIVQ